MMVFLDDHWGAEPPLVAAKVRLRDVLKQRVFREGQNWIQSQRCLVSRITGPELRLPAMRVVDSKRPA